MARVLVTDAARGSAVAIIRSIGRAGHEVVAADSDSRSAGCRSRYAAARVAYPPPLAHPGAAAEALVRAAVEHGVDLIVPVSDEIIFPLLESRDRLPVSCAIALPERRALEIAADKRLTLELCGRLGIPVPASVLVEDRAGARRAAPALGWPVVLKPIVSRRFAGGTVQAMRVSYANGAAELDARMGELEGRCPVLLQEYTQGEGHGIGLLLDHGRPLASFQHRRLREVPISGGASSFRESVPLDPALHEHAVRLLGELDWTGLAMVEFKVGPRGPVVMEVNGRVWGSLPLAVRAGVDFPSMLVELFVPGARNGRLEGAHPYSVGVRSRNLDLEMLWIGSVLRGRRRYPFLASPRRREALRVALRLPLPGDGYDVLSLDDPHPGFAEVAAVARKLRRKARDAA